MAEIHFILHLHFSLLGFFFPISCPPPKVHQKHPKSTSPIVMPRAKKAQRKESTPRRSRRGEASSSRAPRDDEPRQRRRRRDPTPEPTPSPPLSPLPWPLETDGQTEKYRILRRREVTPSKFFDAYTMHSLGLHDEIHTFLARIGWTQFSQVQTLSYKEVTYEILSTIHANYNPYAHNDQPCIFFRCLGVDRELSMSQFNAIFGFPDGGRTRCLPSFDAGGAWAQLSTQDRSDYDSGRSKSTYLRNHALRYIHRVMAHSIFGRGLSRGVVNRTELFFLWAMSNNVQVNSGVWVLKHLLHVAKMPSGDICIGGLLTVIASAFGFVPLPDVHHAADGPHLVDIAMLVNMKLCRHIGHGQYRLIDHAGHVMEPEPEEEEEQGFDAEQEHDPLLPEGAQFVGQMQEPQPDMGDHDAGGHQPPQPDFYTQQLLDRMERLEVRMDRSEEQHADFQRQVLELLHRNEESMHRMEDRWANWK